MTPRYVLSVLRVHSLVASDRTTHVYIISRYRKPEDRPPTITDNFTFSSEGARAVPGWMAIAIPWHGRERGKYGGFGGVGSTVT
jgi:hypothetical protein